MEYYTVFFLGLILILLSYALWYLQPTKIYKIDITQKVLRKTKILYKQYQGSYLEITNAFNEIIDILNTQKFEKDGRVFGQAIQEQIGIFFDDSEKLEDEKQARALYGVVLPENEPFEIQEEIINTFKSMDYNFSSLPLSEALHGEVPNDEYYFYILRALEFQPVLKGNPEEMRLKYREFQQNELRCKIEIYDRNTIHFYLPLQNLEKFQLSSHEKGKLRQEEDIVKKEQ